MNFCSDIEAEALTRHYNMLMELANYHSPFAGSVKIGISKFFRHISWDGKLSLFSLDEHSLLL